MLRTCRSPQPKSRFERWVPVSESLARADTVVGLETKTVVGLRPSFSAHVRWCEHGAPVRSCGTRDSLRGRPVVSHICQNQADMGHPALVAGREPKSEA